MNPRKPKTDQARLPKKTRAKKPPVFQMTKRDIELIRAVLKYRFLTVDQFAWLFPLSSKRGLENRLRLLFHNKYLNRVILVESLSRKLVYAMNEKGSRFLAETDKVPREQIKWQRYLNKLTDANIRHFLAINDILISFENALTKAQAKRDVEQFRALPSDIDKHKLTVTLVDQNGSRYHSSVIPDAVIGIKFRGGEFGLFFVEVDRATMSVNRWRDKIFVYHEFSRSPELRERFKTGWFIVLTVTTSKRRATSLAEGAVSIGGRRAFWFSTTDAISPESILKSIWVRASDLFQVRNERMYQIGDIERVDKFSILDTVRG